MKEFELDSYLDDQESVQEAIPEEPMVDDFKPIGEPETVNHPFHYSAGEFECIDVMVDVFGLVAVENFCLLNAFKYLWRTDRKGELEDIKKADWYLQKIIKLESGVNN